MPDSAVTEETIRDQLADRLEILEPGLQLLDIEHHLPNRHGAYGFVDLLARDQHGLLVIIELKRADAPARQTIHEVFKYLALVRQNHGLPSARMRAMVLSTTWHELFVPFSDFVRSVDYAVDGFRLTVDETTGEPQSAIRVEPLPADAEVRFAPFHGVACFSSSERRESYSVALEKALHGAGVDEYVTFLLRDTRPSPVSFPFAHVLAIPRIQDSQRQAVLQQTAIPIEPYEDLTYPDWDIEEYIIGQLMRARDIEYDEYIPTDYSQLVRTLNVWKVERLSRTGTRIASPDIYPDEALIAAIAGTDGGNPETMNATTSPRLKARWAEITSGCATALQGKPKWLAVASAYLRQLSDHHLSASVGVHIFDSADLVTELVAIYATGVLGFLPSLEILLDDQEKGLLHACVGLVVWDGLTKPDDPERLMAEVFDGDVFAYGLMRTTKETWQVEQEVARFHGLEFVTAEIDLAKDAAPQLLEVDGEQLTRQPFDGDKMLPVTDFVQTNREYLAELERLIQSKSSGKLYEVGTMPKDSLAYGWSQQGLQKSVSSKIRR